MMSVAAFSPRKLQLFNQNSPRGSTRKRSLFPSNSPQSNDLGLISELDLSSGSETYSPAPASPSLSITPSKEGSSPRRPVLGNRLNFDDISASKNSFKSSSKKSFGKENMARQLSSSRKSPRKSSHKAFLEKEDFNDRFTTILSDDKEDISEVLKLKSVENFTTPKKSTSITNNNAVRRSPRSATKTEASIKPVSFYGSNIAPILATNQTNRVGGVKCVFRPIAHHQPRAKTKLNFEDGRHSKKRERSKSIDAMREAKRRKAVFTGVHHAIPKPTKHVSPPLAEKKQLSIREKARNTTDLSRTPYVVKKESMKVANVWDHTVRFTKPLRHDESPCLSTKKKFFKTFVQESPRQIKLRMSPDSSGCESSPHVPKKRRLLDTRRSYLDGNSPGKPTLKASDIRELIDDDRDKLQDKAEVDDILLRLEEDDEEEKKKEAERQMLMNILEDSPGKAMAIDSLSNCTASLDLNDSPSGHGCSRFSLEDDNSSETPKRYFSVFNTSSNSSASSGGKSKWRGVGASQMQIDAGQKLFGPHQCRECGMLYQAGEAEDEAQHRVFHNNLSVLRHTGWKNEKVVGNFGCDYIIEISSDNPRSWQQRVLEILSVVDKNLGIMYETPSVITNQKVYLYIAEKRVVGCMMAVPVSSAYRMIGSESDVDICSQESYPAKCGISRMWTLFSRRRCGIASKMLDTVRRNFLYGYILSKDDVAFSVPTPDGKKFAAKYMDSPKFLVYTGF